MSSPASALDYAMRLLARRDHTRRELFARLSGKGFSPAESEEAIARLVAWGYLDERAIARRWIEDCQMRRPRGRALAAAELEARGIPEEIVREALSHYPPGARGEGGPGRPGPARDTDPGPPAGSPACLAGVASARLPGTPRGTPMRGPRRLTLPGEKR